MSSRYQAGIVLPGYNALKVANAPTIGTATNTGATTISVTFTAPSCVGGGAISSYTVFACCGVKLTTGASSPLVVTGLTTGTPYTFKAIATNAYGPSYPSAASNSATPAVIQGQQAYTSAGTYSWVAPSGVTSVSVVAVGGGAGGLFNNPCLYGAPNGGGGGGLGYKNNYSVNPGCSYTVVVGAGGPASSCGCTGVNGGQSYFVSCGTVKGGGGVRPCATIPNYVGDGGGKGGRGGNGCGGVGKTAGAGGGAGGYSGCGGYAGVSFRSFGGGGGSGGGGGGGGRSQSSSFTGGAGGGVGILGQGSDGTGGAFASPAGGGGGGSGGTAGAGGNNTSVSSGGTYGGGGASGRLNAGTAGTGGVGAVRIIWPGTSRSFPSTNTGNL